MRVMTSVDDFDNDKTYEMNNPMVTIRKSMTS